MYLSLIAQVGDERVGLEYLKERATSETFTAVDLRQSDQGQGRAHQDQQW